MRIVVYSPTLFPPVIDGTSLQATRQIDLLSEDNEVLAITFSVDRDLKPFDASQYSDSIQRLSPKFLDSKKFPTLSGVEVAKKIKEFNPDAIGVRGWYQFKAFEDIFSLNSKSRIYWHVDGIYECHDRFKNKPDYVNFLRRVILSQVNIVAHSNQDRNLLLKMGFNDERIKELPPIINQELICQTKNWSSPFLLSVGRFFPYKGHEDVLRVVKSIDQNLDLVLAGATDSKYAEEIVNRLMQQNTSLLLNPSDRVLFELYKKATHFLLASTVESLGVVTLESIATGCIPLVRKLGGIVSYLPDDFMFSDDIEFTRKLKFLIKPEVAKLKFNQLQNLRDKLSYTRVKEQFQAVYGGLR